MPTMAPVMTMTGAELACMRAFLGFSPAQMVDFLALGEQHGLRRLQRMEKGEAAIPSGIVEELDEMYEMTNNLVANMVVQYKAKVRKADGADVILLTQRDGVSYDCGSCGHRDDDHDPDGGCRYTDEDGPCDCTSKRHYPACWHRAVCARVAQQVGPGLVIHYGVQHFCDDCGRMVNISDQRGLPDGWVRVKVGENELGEAQVIELCGDCAAPTVTDAV